MVVRGLPNRILIICAPSSYSTGKKITIIPVFPETFDGQTYAKRLSQSLTLDPDQSWVYELDSIVYHQGELVNAGAFQYDSTRFTVTPDQSASEYRNGFLSVLRG